MKTDLETELSKWTTAAAPCHIHGCHYRSQLGTLFRLEETLEAANVRIVQLAARVKALEAERDEWVSLGTTVGHIVRGLGG